MLLKKIHNVGTNGKSLGIAGIEVKYAPKGVKHLTQSFVDEGVQEGWLTFGGGKMSIAGVDGKPVVELNVIRMPGRYCCICEEKLPYDQFARDDKGRTSAEPGFDASTAKTDSQRLHMDVKHKGEPSPDPTNPAGYRWETYYTVVNPGEKDNMTKEEAAEFEQAHRQAFHDRISKLMKSAKKEG